MSSSFESILSEFGFSNSSFYQLHDLGNAGGFSGSNICRVTTAKDVWCLRRWPAGTSTSRVSRIHASIQQIALHGFELLAVPRFVDSSRQTYTQRGAFIFELSPWLSGVADYADSGHEIQEKKLAAAMAALARFHTIAATCGIAKTDGIIGAEAYSPGMQLRLDRCRRLLLGELNPILIGLARYSQSSSDTVHAQQVASLKILTDEFRRLAPAVLPRLEIAASMPTRLQLCLRDIWHDHVLFQDGRVSGIIDYDAIGQDAVAGDIARLLGSLAGNSVASWRHGIDAYCAIRPLSEVDLKLIDGFDWGNTLLSGMQWVSWICVDRRQFSNVEAVQGRLDHWVSRLYGRQAAEPLVS